jgi:hypothetical protein
MEIEVGKRYRIDEEVVKSYSTPYYAIGIDNFYQAFPGMVVVVSSVQSNSRWVDTHSGYSLKVECLLPLLEEGMKVAVSTSCFGEDGDIDEDEYYETYPDGVGVIVELEDDGMHGVGGEGFFYIREKHLTPITDDVKTEAKEQEMTYVERQAKWLTDNGVVEGTKLRVVRKAEKHENGWNTFWGSAMDESVGQEVVFDALYGDGRKGIVLEDCGLGFDNYVFPYFVLELAESKLDKDIMLLKEAEKKWVGVVYDGKVDGGPKDCPCCEEYFEDDCDGCPIGNACKGIGYSEWCEGTIEGPLLRKVNDAKSEALARDVLTKIGDIRRELEQEKLEKDKREADNDKERDTLDNYEYVVNGKPTGIKVGEYLQLEIGEVKSGNKVDRSTLITLEYPYSGSRQRCAGTPTGFISDGPDVLKKHFKMNDDGSIKVCVY